MRRVAFLVMGLALVSLNVAPSAEATGDRVCRVVKEKYRCKNPAGKWRTCHRKVRRCRTSCAPEVQEGNLDAVQRVLGEIARAPEFSDARRFREKLAELGMVQDPAVRFGEYLALIGLEESSEAELVELFERPDVDERYVVRLMAALDLTHGQARTVIDALTRALKGDLR